MTNDMMFETYNSCVLKRVPLVEEWVFRRILLVEEIRMAEKDRNDSRIIKKATRQLGLSSSMPISRRPYESNPASDSPPCR